MKPDLLPRRKFIGDLVAAGSAALTASLLGQPVNQLPVLGPIPGHADDASAMVWLRAVEPGEHSLEVTDSAGKTRIVKLMASEQADLCLHWQINKNGEHVFSYHLTADDLKPKS